MKKILIVITFILLCLSLFLLITKNVKPQKNLDETIYISFNYYSKDNFSAEKDSKTFILDETSNDVFTVNSDKDLEYIEIISIDENLDKLNSIFISPSIEKNHTVNFYYTLSETIPNIQIIFKTKKGTMRRYTPIYNGIDGTYDFSIAIQ